ncbi:MAG: carbohydrate ABC transporter substrate-binding protein, partial [Gammaproteobacteria bacterium]|nr:carbohydrate ABC transporter substrate-binding protein [Gammaproteobacteria bacterium]
SGVEAFLDHLEVGLHRVNWLWANPDVLKKAGVSAMPQTWPEFFAAADQIQTSGAIALAHGGQSWQDFTLFESVALGLGGVQYYQDALVKLDAKALNSSTTTQVLETFRKLKGYTDKASAGRDWNLTTALIIQGQAGFQFMGDWAKGEFSAAGKQSGRDYLCAAAPGTANAFSFNVDSFILFKLKDAQAEQAQQALASAILSPSFQEVFNQNKGSIPVRLGHPMDAFDACAQRSAQDFMASAESGTLVPSIAHSMAVSPAVQGAMQDVVTQFWNDSKLSVAEAQKRLLAAARQ